GNRANRSIRTDLAHAVVGPLLDVKIPGRIICKSPDSRSQLGLRGGPAVSRKARLTVPCHRHDGPRLRDLPGAAASGKRRARSARALRLREGQSVVPLDPPAAPGGRGPSPGPRAGADRITLWPNPSQTPASSATTLCHHECGANGESGQP